MTVDTHFDGPSDGALSVRGALGAMTQALREGGIETPERDARLLVAAALGRDSQGLLMEPERVLAGAEMAHLAGTCRRRLLHEPVSRILGRRDFYGRMFAIDAATLDPRPDTETIVEAVLAIAATEGWRTRPLRILDVGTGSGCLIVTLLAELPRATGVATDISAEALAMAQRNAGAHGVGDRLQVLRTRSLDGIERPFDLLVSNPPYIPSQDIAALAPDVRDHDPRVALDGGADGLDIYREIAGRLGAVVPRGWAAFEVGAGQAEAVAALMATALGAAHRETRFDNDLGGHIRCVTLMTHS